MSFDIKQQKVLTKVKDNLKVMKQVIKLEKDIAVSEKKLGIQKSKMSNLIKILDDKNYPDKKRSIQAREEKGKLENSSPLFVQD